MDTPGKVVRRNLPGAFKGSWAMAILALSGLIATAQTALAEPADVIGVEISTEAEGSYRFDVTVRSDESGWEKYADRWEVLAPDGTILGVRELAHPHVDEQPFTRSLSNVVIPAAISSVTVRAHDSVDGFGGAEMTVELP